MGGLETMQATMAYENAKATPTLQKNTSYREMRQVAEDFEALFLSQALKPMFENIEPASPFGGGPGEDIWQAMQVQEYGKAIAKQGGIGIADHVMQQMIRMQEGN